jgi:transposase-like protein
MTILANNLREITQQEVLAQVNDSIVDLLRSHAKTILAEALEIEVNDVISKLRQSGRDVVRNGYLPERSITSPIGKIEVNVPRIRSKEGERVNFNSTLIPKYLRKSKSIDTWAAYAYLKGISENDIPDVLSKILGQEAKNLGHDVVSRLKKSWIKEFEIWNKRDLSNLNCTYVYVDGLYQSLRNETDKVCILAMIGIDENGKKHLVAMQSGFRESTQSWREFLVDLTNRGFKCPKLAIGDGSLGFWAALREKWTGVKEQRCWFHKTGNILNNMPKSLHEKAKDDIHQIWMAESKKEAEKAIKVFSDKYFGKYEKAVNCLTKDQEQLLTFFDFPAEHFAHIRTTNAIESTFATLRHRTKRSKGAFSKDSAMSMIFQLAKEAEKSWKTISAPKILADVIAGVEFKDGIKVEKLAS